MYKISFFVVLQPNLRVYHSQSSTLRFCAISLGELWKKLQKARRTPSRCRSQKSTVKRYGFNAPATVHAVLEQVDSITDFICEAVLKHGQDKGLC